MTELTRRDRGGLASLRFRAHDNRGSAADVAG